jgi:hypothetical protein
MWRGATGKFVGALNWKKFDAARAGIFPTRENSGRRDEHGQTTSTRFPVHHLPVLFSRRNAYIRTAQSFDMSAAQLLNPKAESRVGYVEFGACGLANKYAEAWGSSESQHIGGRGPPAGLQSSFAES